MPIMTGKFAVVLYPGKTEMRPENVVRIEFSLGDTRGSLLPLFTGAEMAEKFVITQATAMPEMTVYSIPSHALIEPLLRDLERMGTTHVNFNADPRNANPIPIAEVINRFANPIRLGGNDSG